MNQKSQFLLALALLCVCATALLVQAQSVSVRVLNKAIYDMLNDKTTSRGFTSIHQAYFGDSVMHAPVDKCTTFTSWPSASEVGSDPTFAQILTRKYIVFGTNSVNNSPKRYNYVGVGPNYGSCTGFEADIASSIAYRIAGLVPRSSIVDFTCPYQNDGNGVVRGNLATNVTFNSISDLDQPEITLCVQKGLPYTLTRDAVACHAYVAPLINGLFQAKTDAPKLTYLGLIGSSSDVSIAVRKSAVSSRSSNAASMNLCLLLIFSAIFGVFALLL
ncbi:hypothetical protein FDP41_009315 [Naegleria fowleri]|uniref:Uncharacterized protein n=1 Tax=Naegleria fowleri TaxID=5763 RepID=A0A6A5BBX8_NAEFO|nr:uncharacterized protein FDP41_009315 [Naegleria fowleri]KAF0972412.1 hypothetical protein FDP41_009315 [Naegleria fowleri]